MPPHESWQTIYWLINSGVALCSVAFAGISLFRSPSCLVRPAFMIAIMVMIFYQFPLVFYSSVFYKKIFDVWWFAASIHVAVLANLLWVRFTPQLNHNTIFQKPDNSDKSLTFNSFELWFSIALFFTLLFAYLYKVPPTCTALYSIFFDPKLALLIREISVKLVGTNYATYALSILSTTIAPIVAFLSLHILYRCLQRRKFLWIPLWFMAIILAFMSTLISGAKGNLIPTFIVVSVAGFLSAYRWYWRILLVIILNAMLIMILTLFSMQRISMNVPEQQNYNFGKCIEKLQVCEPTRILLDSLKARDFSLDLPKSKILSLEQEREKACAPPILSAPSTIENIKNKETSISAIPTSPTVPAPEIINPAPSSTPIIPENPPPPRLTERLTDNEKAIEEEHAKAKAIDHINSLINRAFVIPLIVAHWHFLYVEEYGAPGFSGISIARKFSDNYIDMPSRICEVYEFIRSGGDKTSTCTAPTSYLFTYPAYMGIFGLLLATITTIVFDIIASLVIKHSSTPLNYLTVGLVAVAGINFMTADFTTTMLSHGAGFALVIMIFFCLCRFIMNKHK